MPVSTPYFDGFIPFGYQRDCLHLLYDHDYSKCTPEILLSGSVGSAKSILCAHWAIAHCLRNPGARVAISRQSLPDLRKTIYLEIVEHLDNSFIEGVHFKKRDNTCDIRFANGSEIIAVSFGDKRWNKVRSLKLSGVIIEEGTDFDPDFYEDGGGFKLFKARLRRIHNVKENFLIVATNPDSPDHFLYDYFIEGEQKHDSRFCFYSVTTDNPFLDAVYIKQLKQDYSKLEAERYLRGKWVSLMGKGIYHSFSEKNISKTDYKVDRNYPIYVTFDFNIAAGKPLSSIMYQYVNKVFHFFAESIIEDAYTYEGVDDFYNRELINRNNFYIIQGDATGRNRDPSSKQTNYDVIEEYLARRLINFEIDVPRKNPPIRTRHSIVNAQCCNDLNQVRVKFYKNVPVAIQGMKLTKLKKGANYIEDDSAKSPYQHVTTAIGYGICATIDTISQKRQGTVEL
jgi:PBSX family phage terminase large subunit